MSSYFVGLWSSSIPPTPTLKIRNIQYIPRNMHTVFALLCFVVVIHWLIFPYPSGLLHWHCGNLTIAPVPAKQPWWIWINTSCEFIMNDCITTTKQNTTKPCAYLLGYTVRHAINVILIASHNGIVMYCKIGSYFRGWSPLHNLRNNFFSGACIYQFVRKDKGLWPRVSRWMNNLWIINLFSIFASIDFF